MPGASPVSSPTHTNASKMNTACADLAASSYKCLENHNGDGNNCTEHFKAYKACKKEERERIVEARRKQFA